eukprot:PLAT322.1.p1 GENE.PLAT322.1~~PLAT322.1.p1  ORF type:complete len:481 (+),score=293.37 PLAT322.1:69-1511(+)
MPKGKRRKKGKKKKGRRARTAEGGDGGAGAEAAREEEERRRIEMGCTKLAERKRVEEGMYAEFQQQKERLNYFWIVEKKALEDKKAELRNKERELQDLEEKHQVEIKVYKQRVKHLLYEQQNEVTLLKTEAERTLKLQQDAHRGAEAELKTDRRVLKLEHKEMELSHEDYLKSLKQEQDRAITLLRQEFERKAKEMQQKYEKKMRSVREELEARRRDDIARIEERKNRRIAELMKAHEKAFGEIKNYYNDITHNNLDRIKSLKEDVALMKKKEAADEKRMIEIAQENKKMSEPLKNALRDVKRLRQELEAYNRDREQLKGTKARLLVVEDSTKSLAWEHEVLQQRFAEAVTERDALYERFQASVYEVQQKAGFRNQLLEKKLETLTEAVEKKEAHLNEVLVSTDMDPTILGQVRRKVDDAIEAKNTTIRELHRELERVTAAHNEVVRSYEAKLLEYGIPTDELGFRARMEPPPAKIDVEM